MTDLFIDSGAFSAWSQGVDIDINEYMEFIKEHSGILELYANLDIIAKGNRQEDKKESAEKTLINQKIMEKEGLSPLPVFHIGEPFEYLQYYIENYEYIGLGGMVGKSKNVLTPWLNECFQKYICDKKGIPKVKVHGFGLTTFLFMLKYPWYSVDSTTWVIMSRMGKILIPDYKNGKWIYDENSYGVTVTTKNIQNTTRNIHTLPPKEKEVILRYINEKGFKLGKSHFEKVSQFRELADNERWAEKKPKDKGEKRLLEIIEEEGVSNRYTMRDRINIRFFQDLEKSIPEWPWAFTEKKLLGFTL